MVGVPVLLQRLEEDEGVSRPVPELVLRQVARDRIDPGRKFLALVEALQVPVHPHERFLDQVLRSLPIAHRTVYEVDQAGIVAIDQFPEGALLALQEALNHLTVREGP